MTATFGMAMLGNMFGMQAIAEISASGIVDCLFAGTLIAVFAGLISRASQRQNSSLRFAVWFSALIAVAASPVLSSATWPRGSMSAGFTRAAVTLPGSWAVYVFGIWAGVAAWLLLRLGFGLWRLHELRATLLPVELEKLDPQIRATLNGHGGFGAVPLCTCERVQVPAVIGLVKPVIVVPAWVLDELSAGELNQILLHELAHLQRRDGWTNLAQQVIKAVLFFHPAVWWIEGKISLEREMACDDVVLAKTESPRAYAECLRHLAEKTLLRRSLALAQALLGRVRQTSMRVAQILEARHPRSAKHGWRGAFSLAALLLACGLIEFNEPHLIAFQDIANAAASAAATYVPPITPVSFKTMTAESTARVAHSTSVRAIGPNRNYANRIATDARLQLGTQHLKSENLLRLASLHRREVHAPKLIASEAVFVMFENCGYGSSGLPLYEIEVLHVTVLHPSISPVHNEIPRKEI